MSQVAWMLLLHGIPDVRVDGAALLSPFAHRHIQPMRKLSCAFQWLNGNRWSLLLSQPRPGASRGIDIARGQSMHPEEDVGIYGRSLAFQGQQPALPMR
jgi:hypothetical protein